MHPLISLLLLFGLLLPLRAADPVNPALLYWQAFSQMPDLGDDDQERLKQWRTTPLDDDAKALLERSQKSLHLLHKGAAVKGHCDWGIDLADGFSALVPHLSQSRQLAGIALLQARSDLSAGRDEAAAEVVRSVRVQARHTAADRLLVCVLVQNMMEGMALDFLEDHAAKLGQAARRTARAELPPLHRVAQAVPLEQEMVATTFDQIRRGVLDPGLLGIAPDGQAQDEDAIRDLLATADQTLGLYDEMIRLCSLPEKERVPGLKKFEDGLQAQPPFARMIVPSLSAAVQREIELNQRIEQVDRLLAP